MKVATIVLPTDGGKLPQFEITLVILECSKQSMQFNAHFKRN